MWSFTISQNLAETGVGDCLKSLCNLGYGKETDAARVGKLIKKDEMKFFLLRNKSLSQKKAWRDFKSFMIIASI